jgi:signal transduction histidine kinase
VRARDDFLSIASHELRTPLSTLALGTSELIRAADSGRMPTPAQLKRQAERLRSQAQRLERLVTTVLDVSRIVQGRVKLFPEQLDASAVVREHCERMREDAARAGSTIDLTCEEQIMGCFDRTRLEQIVDNLLSNAIKFGGGKPIDVTLAATPELVSLTVHDHGLGIAKEDQARIFERFERAVSSKHYGGLGLGLWVVRQIVESMGGTIFVTSELGKGSTFVVEWPRIGG